MGPGRAGWPGVLLIAVLLTIATGVPTWDAIGTLMIGLLLIVLAGFVAIEVKAMLMGQSVDPELQAQVSKFYAGGPEIDRVISLIILRLGNDVLVPVQASLKQVGDVGALLAEIHAMERALKAEFPVARWSFFAPDTVA